jgi:hypothetical protein
MKPDFRVRIMLDLKSQGFAKLVEEAQLEGYKPLPATIGPFVDSSMAFVKPGSSGLYRVQELNGGALYRTSVLDYKRKTLYVEENSM